MLVPYKAFHVDVHARFYFFKCLAKYYLCFYTFVQLWLCSNSPDWSFLFWTMPGTGVHICQNINVISSPMKTAKIFYFLDIYFWEKVIRYLFLYLPSNKYCSFFFYMHCYKYGSLLYSYFVFLVWFASYHGCDSWS